MNTTEIAALRTQPDHARYFEILVPEGQDWRASINVVVSIETLNHVAFADGCSLADVLNRMSAAVEFFTATRINLSGVDGGIRCWAVGYRAGPAGP